MIVAVIGLGTFGAKTTSRLFEKDVEVLAIDSNSELIEKIKDRCTHAVCVDVTDERAMRSINISDVDIAIVAIGENIEMSILAVTMLRKLGVGRIIARATSQIHEHVLGEIGASEIIKVEEEMGEIVAAKIVAPHVLERYNFAAGYSIIEVKLDKKYHGLTLVESRIRQNYNLNVVAIQRKRPYVSEEGKSSFKTEISDSPMPRDLLQEDDILVIVGKDNNISKFLKDL